MDGWMDGWMEWTEGEGREGKREGGREGGWSATATGESTGLTRERADRRDVACVQLLPMKCEADEAQAGGVAARHELAAQVQALEGGQAVQRAQQVLLQRRLVLTADALLRVGGVQVCAAGAGGRVGTVAWRRTVRAGRREVRQRRWRLLDRQLNHTRCKKGKGRGRMQKRERTREDAKKGRDEGGCKKGKGRGRETQRRNFLRSCCRSRSRAVLPPQRSAPSPNAQHPQAPSRRFQHARPAHRPHHTSLMTRGSARRSHPASLITPGSSRGAHHAGLITQASSCRPHHTGLGTRGSAHGPRHAGLIIKAHHSGQIT
eukprot:359987-Chlamydomonas_euryale.AAC.4